MLRHTRHASALAALAIGLGLTASTVAAQSANQPSTTKGDWPMYTADLRGSKYSPLDQITAENFDDMEIAWRFKTDNLGTRPEFKLEGTPVAIDGVLYTTAGTRRSVISLDGMSGELRWVYNLREGKRGAAAPRQLSGRGLSYWTDGQGDDRVLFVTPGYRLIALNAHTGRPIESFGTDGIVDMKVGVIYNDGKQIDLDTGEIGLHSTPTVAGDVVLVGSAMKEGMTVTTHDNTKGVVRCYDARTGKRLWTFNGIPKRGEFGYDTWLDDSALINGNTGVWTQITVDPELGLAYLPVESPTSDYYGGMRPGNDLFGESLVAVDLKTGQRKWHFQFVHHPIWDDDMSSAPLLMDVAIDGAPTKVVAVPSKQSFLYVFDRETGEPVWPIVETPVPQGDVPGEWYSPTQPIPTKPQAYGRPGLRIPDDLIDFTPAMRAEALELLKRYKWGGGDYPYSGTLYNPPIVGNVDGLLGAINLGNASGGTNWPGGGFDPETGIAYASASLSSVAAESVAPPPEGFSDIPYQAGVVGRQFRVRQAAGTGTYADATPTPRPRPQPRPAGGAAARRGGGFVRMAVQGLPIVKPPYGIIAAIDVNKGELLWQTPHGDTPDDVRHNPALEGIDVPKTGQRGSVGVLITKTLVIAGDPQVTTTDEHPRGAMLRAYDKATGEQVGAVYMPAQQSGSPMTYEADGRQFIVVAVSGGAYSGEYLAFGAPVNRRGTANNAAQQ